jgi:hypothetical protein
MMVPVTEPDLDALTDELYDVPPTEFVARRDQLVAQARAAGDRGLATTIKALRRPTVGAWYLNTGARAGLGSLRDLLGLGEKLRDAQAAGDFAALRDLAKRRGPLVSDVVRELTVLLRARGAAATPAGLDEVRGTLAAALADPDVAEEVESGRLDRAHSYGGFGELTVGLPAPASKPATAPTVASEGMDAAARAAEQAERERVEETRQELRAAEADQAELATRRAEAEVEIRLAKDRVAALTDQLAAARHELKVAEVELTDAANDEKDAHRRVERARRQLPS